MKTMMTSIAAGSLLAAFAMAQTPSYTVTDLGPVGPAPGQPFFVAPNGLIAGTVATNGPTNAMLWYKKLKLNIAKPGLGGANSVAFAVDGAGQAVGEAETSVVDPKGEDFCGFKAMGLPSAGNSCLPFLWQNGAMTALPTLGGNNGAVNQINKNGEMAGLAETARPDPGCPAPQAEAGEVVEAAAADRHAGEQELGVVAGRVRVTGLGVDGEVLGDLLPIDGERRGGRDPVPGGDGVDGARCQGNAEHLGLHREAAPRVDDRDHAQVLALEDLVAGLPERGGHG